MSVRGYSLLYDGFSRGTRLTCLPNSLLSAVSSSSSYGQMTPEGYTARAAGLVKANKQLQYADGSSRGYFEIEFKVSLKVDPTSRKEWSTSPSVRSSSFFIFPSLSAMSSMLSSGESEITTLKTLQPSSLPTSTSRREPSVLLAQLTEETHPLPELLKLQLDFCPTFSNFVLLSLSFRVSLFLT